MTLADVYCRFNRARGMEVKLYISSKSWISKCMVLYSVQLVSPDDIVNACKLFEVLHASLRYSRVCRVHDVSKISSRLRVFESGVLVVQSLSHSEEVIIENSSKLVKKIFSSFFLSE